MGSSHAQDNYLLFDPQIIIILILVFALCLLNVIRKPFSLDIDEMIYFVRRHYKLKKLVNIIIDISNLCIAAMYIYIMCINSYCCVRDNIWLCLRQPH